MENKKILIIDDEKEFTDIIKAFLEEKGGFTVLAENDGLRGIEAAISFKPDLILLDLMMPGVDGAYVASQVKHAPGIQNTPVIFLTAAITREEGESRDGVIGGHPFLAKPVQFKDLMALIGKHIC